MQEEKIPAAENVHSFLSESLVWNVPDHRFGNYTYTSGLRAVLAHTFNKTTDDVDSQEWGEVNELKYLFRTSQRWSRQQAHSCLQHEIT